MATLSHSQQSARSDLRAAVNAEIYAIARQSYAERLEERFDFLCECGSDACSHFVAMTLDEFERRSADARIIARAHAEP